MKRVKDKKYKKVYFFVLRYLYTLYLMFITL